MSDRAEGAERHGPERNEPGGHDELPLSGARSDADGDDGTEAGHDGAAGTVPGRDAADDTLVDVAPVVGAGSDGGGSPRTGEDPADLDELTLRRLLHQTVGDLEPSPDTLEHLHRAVPHRRARKRQALVGAAAAVVLGGAAIPAVLHTDLVPGGGGEKPISAASHSETRGPGEEHGGRTGGSDAQSPQPGEETAGEEGQETAGSDSASPTAGGDSEGTATADIYASAPTCAPDQLGQGTADVGQPDGEGRIYGSFEVTNTSADPCAVEGEGIVGVNALGRANDGNLQVVDHIAGDGTALPDPGVAAEELVLQPGDAYMVKFAWVPREGGGQTGCDTATSPPPESGDTSEGGDGTPASGQPSEGGDGTPDASGGSGTSGGGTSGGGGSDGGNGGPGGGAGVSVSHTPDVGPSAAASTVLPGACAGTVYRTGVIAAS
ncbi:hypothetical protein [Streptomyces phytohabitans]|uniref:hypothetical protein n=1 Tax=Streptomyces phytohabitans TaxID=1150371 RepID=UPI00345B4D4B